MSTFLRRESLWIPIILLVTLVGGWIELDLYAPSFPQMMHHFSTSEQMVQWTLSLNFLGFFLASLLCGPLADSFGRRKIIVVGSLIFVVGSALCLAATSMLWMLIGRLIQGIGVSAPVTVCMAIIADIYQGERQIRLLSRMNSSVTVTMALAPIAGVFLTDNFGWQANFMLILALAMMGLLLMLFFVPETHPLHLRTKFNAKNLISGYATLLVNRDFMMNNLALCFSITPYYILIGILPLLFMEALKVSIHEYAFYQGSIVGLFSILSLGIPFILSKYDTKKVVAISTFLAVSALLLTFLFSLWLPDNPLLITGLMWIYVCGIVVPPTMMFTSAMDMFPGLRACASSLIQSSRMLSMSVGTALAGSLYEGQLRPVAFIMLIFMIMAVPLIIMIMKKHQANQDTTIPASKSIAVMH